MTPRISIGVLIVLILFSCSTCSNMVSKKIDWQGHRGARGLFPENTLEAFIGALDYEITTLELDVVVSKDNQVIVSHEPWMSEEICMNPNGEEFEDGKTNFNIYKMNYADIKKFDCGSKVHPRFPDQKKLKTYKPLLSEVIEAVDDFCKKNNRERVAFDIEIKSDSNYVGTYFPEPTKYVQMVEGVLANYDMKNRLTLQSFDLNILEALHQEKTSAAISFLVENEEGFEANLEKLNFLPDIYSPYYLFVTKELVNEVHQKNMKLIPWTVNDKETMLKLKALGVDGIITDYPNKIKNINDD